MNNAEDLLAHTQTLFRELREAWFNEVVKEPGWHDMTTEQEAVLEADNGAMRKAYDAQTERMLQGEPLRVAPYYEADLDT
jgi:hypothetical protein